MPDSRTGHRKMDLLETTLNGHHQPIADTRRGMLGVSLVRHDQEVEPRARPDDALSG